jgi:hypothetical protein
MENKTPVYTLKAQKTYREKNREKIAEKARERYHKNKESIAISRKIRRGTLQPPEEVKTE